MFHLRATALVLAASVVSAVLVGGAATATAATSACPVGATTISQTEAEVVCQVSVTSTASATTITLPVGVTRYSMMLVGGGGGGYVILGVGANFLSPTLASVVASNGGNAGEVIVHSDDLSATPAAAESTLEVTVGRGGGGTDEFLSGNVYVSNIVASDTTVAVSGGLGTATHTASKGADATRPLLTADPKWTQTSGDGAVGTGSTAEQAPGDPVITGGAGHADFAAALAATTPPSYVESLWATNPPRLDNWGREIARGGHAGAPGTQFTGVRYYGAGGDGYSYQTYVSKGPARDGAFIVRYAFDPTFVPAPEPPLDGGTPGGGTDGDIPALATTGLSPATLAVLFAAGTLLLGGAALMLLGRRRTP